MSHLQSLIDNQLQIIADFQSKCKNPLDSELSDLALAVSAQSDLLELLQVHIVVLNNLLVLDSFAKTEDEDQGDQMFIELQDESVISVAKLKTLTHINCIGENDYVLHFPEDRKPVSRLDFERVREYLDVFDPFPVPESEQ